LGFHLGTDVLSLLPDFGIILPARRWLPDMSNRLMQLDHLALDNDPSMDREQG
jgi:hypothetical protein